MEREPVETFLETLRASEASAATVRAYGTQLRGFASYLEREREDIQKWSQIDSAACSTWVELALHESTAVQRHAALNLFVPWLKSQGMLEGTPMSGIPAPKHPPRAPDFLTLEEVKSLIGIIKRRTKGLSGARDVAIAEVLYSTGISSSELVALNVDDVDFGSSTIHVSGAIREEREAFLTASAKFSLEEWVRQRTSDRGKPAKDSPLFISLTTRRDVRRIPERTVQTMVRDAGKILGYEQMTPRVLRSSFARHLLDKGLHPDDVATMLGNVAGGRGLQYIRRAKRMHREHHPKP